KEDGLFLEEQTVGNGEMAGPRFSLKLEDEMAALLKGCAGRKIVFGIRPEEIRRTPEATGTNGQSMEAVVEAVEPGGAEAFFRFARGNHSFVARMPRGERARVSEKVSLSFDMTAAR